MHFPIKARRVSCSFCGTPPAAAAPWRSIVRRREVCSTQKSFHRCHRAMRRMLALLARLQLKACSTRQTAAEQASVRRGRPLSCTPNQGPTASLGPSRRSNDIASGAVHSRCPRRHACLEHGQPAVSRQTSYQGLAAMGPQQPLVQSPSWSGSAPLVLLRHNQTLASSVADEELASASSASEDSHQVQPGPPPPHSGPPPPKPDVGPHPSAGRTSHNPPPFPAMPRPRVRSPAHGNGSGAPPPASVNGDPRRSEQQALAVSGTHVSQGTAGRKRKPPVYVRASELPLQEKLQLLVDKLADEQEIEVERVVLGTQRCTCPECGNGSNGEDCFAVTLEEDQAMWCCHRATCGFSGGLSIFGQYTPGAPTVGVQRQLQTHPVQVKSKFQPLSPELLAWLKSRGISEATLQRNGVGMERRYHASSRCYMDMIAFPYIRDGTVVNIKYRGLPKVFTQTKGGERIFYGYDDIKGQSEVMIVEGELDKLALEEAGYTNVISVPTGARINKRVRQGAPPAPDKDTEFAYVHNCWERLEGATKIILATDNDEPGAALAEELARRLGREKCWRVKWPKSEADVQGLKAARSDVGMASQAVAVSGAADAQSAGDTQTTQASAQASPQLQQQPQGLEQQDGGISDADAHHSAADAWFRKDANEVLMRDGASALRANVENAEPLPIKGLFRFHVFWGQVYDLYHQGPKGLNWGLSTGWESLDSVYKVVPGELTIVTGVPNSGKSEWLDALAMNLAKAHGWSFALCSMENRPPDHARKLMEKYAQKPFFDAAYAVDNERMSEKEMLEALVWIDEKFHVIKASDEELPTIEWVLDKARAAVARHGIRGLVIDPYNEISHTRPGNFSETEYVSQMLTKVKKFAQHHDCHVWFVAHPRQMSSWTGGAPNLYDISGSAHFINKADNGVVVHRPNTAAAAASAKDGRRGGRQEVAGGDPRAVQVLVRKVRNKLAGRIGDALLRYDRTTGSYEDYYPPLGQ